MEYQRCSFARLSWAAQGWEDLHGRMGTHGKKPGHHTQLSRSTRAVSRWVPLVEGGRPPYSRPEIRSEHAQYHVHQVGHMEGDHTRGVGRPRLYMPHPVRATGGFGVRPCCLYSTTSPPRGPGTTHHTIYWAHRSLAGVQVVEQAQGGRSCARGAPLRTSLPIFPHI